MPASRPVRTALRASGSGGRVLRAPRPGRGVAIRFYRAPPHHCHRPGLHCALAHPCRPLPRNSPLSSRIRHRGFAQQPVNSVALGTYFQAAMLTPLPRPVCPWSLHKTGLKRQPAARAAPVQISQHSVAPKGRPNDEAYRKLSRHYEIRIKPRFD